ncbi:MAG: pyridoxal 5'-phosphate synthase glutaminase subunit PdxT [Blautia sp.]|jgi:5'-phosphate synthase pdxT subunit
MKIAVLAVQGAFIEHETRMELLGATPLELRQKKDLQKDFDGLILPGGESTVMGKLLRDLHIMDPLRERVKDGLPVFGTCAGMILLAKHLTEDPTVHLGTMDITVHRNAYGRQLGSFHTVSGFGQETDVPMTFIRAPYIQKAGPGVDILSTVDDRIIAAREKNQLVTAFHPELDEDLRVHQYFLNIVTEYHKKLSC